MLSTATQSISITKKVYWEQPPTKRLQLKSVKVQSLLNIAKLGLIPTSYMVQTLTRVILEWSQEEVFSISGWILQAKQNTKKGKRRKMCKQVCDVRKSTTNKCVIPGHLNNISKWGKLKLKLWRQFRGSSKAHAFHEVLVSTPSTRWSPEHHRELFSSICI